MNDEERPRFVEYDDTDETAGSDEDNPDGINVAILARGFDGTAFALATCDEKTGVWYLMRGTGAGNPIRTRHAATVMVWQSSALVRDWLARLPDGTKASLMRRSLFIVPVRLAIEFSGSFERVVIATRPVPADQPGAPAAQEYTLGTTPLPKRRKRRKRRPDRHDD